MNKEQKGFFRFENASFDHLERAFSTFRTRFRSILRTHVLINVLIFILLLSEITYLSFFLDPWEHPYFFAFFLALIFFTFFAWGITFQYLNARKESKFESLGEIFLEDCKAFMSYQEGIPDHHIAIANSFCRLAASLKGQDENLYPFLLKIPMLGEQVEKLSVWCHWNDVITMREKLLLGAISEHTKLVHCEPTNLEVHTAIASTYVTLSSLYSTSSLQKRRLLTKDQQEDFQEKFHEAASHAIEEFKILKEYAAGDPWIHTQLAYSYHDLQMPDEEIEEYEKILTLRSSDKEVLYKLGNLYFEQGKNAEGLRIYEKLKRLDSKRAKALIAHYGKQKLKFN